MKRRSGKMNDSGMIRSEQFQICCCLETLRRCLEGMVKQRQEFPMGSFLGTKSRKRASRKDRI